MHAPVSPRQHTAPGDSPDRIHHTQRPQRVRRQERLHRADAASPRPRGLGRLGARRAGSRPLTVAARALQGVGRHRGRLPLNGPPDGGALRPLGAEGVRVVVLGHSTPLWRRRSGQCRYWWRAARWGALSGRRRSAGPVSGTTWAAAGGGWVHTSSALPAAAHSYRACAMLAGGAVTTHRGHQVA